MPDRIRSPRDRVLTCVDDIFGTDSRRTTISISFARSARPNRTTSPSRHRTTAYTNDHTIADDHAKQSSGTGNEPAGHTTAGLLNPTGFDEIHRQNGLGLRAQSSEMLVALTTFDHEYWAQVCGDERMYRSCSQQRVFGFRVRPHERP